MHDLLDDPQDDPALTFTIPRNMAGRTRYPVLLLIDVSGSTAHDPIHGDNGPNADIHRINGAIQKIIALLRTPPSGTPIYNNRDNIDLAILTYSHAVTVNLPWTPAAQLPAMIAPFGPQTVTATGKALLFAVDYGLQHYRAVRQQNVNCGLPNIFHITDGCPTDMHPGSPMWGNVQKRLAQLSPSDKLENRYMAIKNIVAANGCDPNSASGTMELPNGDTITGLQLMTQLAKGSKTFQLDNTQDAFDELVELVTVLIEHTTTLIAGRTGGQSAEPEFVGKHIKDH